MIIKKQALIIILIIILVVGVLNIIDIISLNSMADRILGNEFCESSLNNEEHKRSCIIIARTCEICGKEDIDTSHGNTLCYWCALKTHRCEYCGKKLK